MRRGDASDSIRYLKALRQLVDRHQKEEEQVLVPIVEEHLDPVASENICREHRQLSKSLEQMNKKLSRINNSECSVLEALESSVRLEVMARQQFAREENVTYWFASVCMGQPRWVN